MKESELQELINVQKDAEFFKESIDILKKNFSNQYVAIKDEDVIAHHKNIDAVIKLVEAKNFNPATVFIEFLHPKGMMLIL